MLYLVQGLPKESQELRHMKPRKENRYDNAGTGSVIVNSDCFADHCSNCRRYEGHFTNHLAKDGL